MSRSRPEQEQEKALAHLDSTSELDQQATAGKVAPDPVRKPWVVHSRRKGTMTTRFYVMGEHSGVQFSFDCGFNVHGQALAEFILRACNNHHELLAALKETREFAAAAMRIIADANQTDALISHMRELGLKGGAGARAQDAIAKAEG